MKNKVKILIIWVLILDLGMSWCLWYFVQGIWWVVTLNVLLILAFTGVFIAYQLMLLYMSILSNANETYPTREWVNNHEERNFDIVNLGTYASMYSFDYKSFPAVKGMNWGQCPQLLYYDLGVLKKYHSILKHGGTVAIVICPCSSLATGEGGFGLKQAIRYIRVLDMFLLDPHYYKFLLHIRRIIVILERMMNPFLRYIPQREKPDKIEHNSMNDVQLEKDAQQWVRIWKRQFSIKDYDDPISPRNEQRLKGNIQIMQEIIDFCTERSYKPVVILPSITEHLAKYFTPTFRKIYIYDFIRKLNRDIQVLDYMDDKTFKSDDMYFNSFFLNSKGRKIFTHQVLKDLEIIKK